MFQTYHLEAKLAAEVVQLTADLCRQIQREVLDSGLKKEDRSPVTIADFASQAVVARRLLEDFPDDALVAEEGSAALKQAEQADMLDSVTKYVAALHVEATPQAVCKWIDHGLGKPDGRFWVLDPIDGTKGFLRGDQYVVALALIEDGQVVIGALGCPNLDRWQRPDLGGKGSLVVAVRGEGTWATALGEEHFTRLRVSKCNDPSQARLLRSLESGHTNVNQIAQLEHALGTKHPPVKMDSQAKLAVLAAGGGELLFRLLSPQQPNYREKIWDQAAGSLVIEEAGGRVSDLFGASLDFTTGRELSRNVGVLASNGRLHEAALGALHAIGIRERSEVK